MEYIVLDLEWNQPFSKKSKVKKPLLLHGEIVQIGAVKLSEDYSISDSFKIMVQPKHYTKMNKRVSELTGITTKELGLGFPFPVAVGHFKNWCGRDFCLLTWGPDDIAILQSNMALHRLNGDWLPKTYDAQVIFNDQTAKENRQFSLAYAMEKTGVAPLDAHDALNDAINTARVCQKLDMARGIAEYDRLSQRKKSPASHGREIQRTRMVYAQRKAALKDEKLVDFQCPLCGSKVETTEFVSQNADKYMCMGSCPKGHEFLIRFKFIKRRDGKFTLSRMVYEADDENRNYYTLKKQQAEEAKKTPAKKPSVREKTGERK